MTRRSLLQLPMAAVGLKSSLVGQQSRRPNILLLITDQQSNFALSANGNRYLHTPAMDSLVADGVSFCNAYCTYPVCSPARSSIFTGRLPHETGVRVNGQPVREGVPAMGEVFRAVGYRTVYGGKWHLPRVFGGVVGFEELIGGSALGARMDEPLASACVDFLSEKPREPFLLVASFMNPHDICDWIRGHRGSRRHPNLAAYPPAPANMAVDPDEPEYVQYHRTTPYDRMSEAVTIAGEWNVEDVRQYLHGYYRLVEDVDRQIGRVLAALRAAGLDRNTLIALTADHGEGMGAHRWAQKAAFWEEAAKAPLVIAGAGVRRRGVVDQHSLVSCLDILPTLCDFTGVAPPEGVRGQSLRSAIEGAGDRRPFVVSELSEFGGKDRQGRMLRTQCYKYIAFNGGKRPEQLFDLKLDPGEVYNLVRRPEETAVLAEHRALLARWIADTGDDFRMPLAGGGG